MRPFKVALAETKEISSAVAGRALVAPAWVSKVLAARGIDFVARGCETRADLEAYASDADLVWVWGSPVLTPDRLDVLAKCGAILRSGSGTDNVPVAEATKHHMLVINTPAAVAQEVSDHAIALLFSIVRQVVALDRLMRSGVWEARRENSRWHLQGSTLGLVGFGQIARLVARKMSGFGLRMLANDPWVSSDQMRAMGAEPADFQAVLSQSDFISLHCALTTATRHLIGEKEIRLMKPHAILINTSRGPIVDEAALVRALQEKRIGGAGLDVFEREPLPADSPLLQLENVVVTPHLAGYSDLFPECFWRYSVESVIAIADGYWPRSVVNPDVEPKWRLKRRDWPAEPETYEAEREDKGQILTG